MTMLKTPTQEDVDLIEFLKESNAIEGVYDNDSLMQALYAWEYLIKEEVMTLGVVLKTHKILMLHQRGLRPDQKGYLRTIPVYVGPNAMLAPEHLHTALEEWCGHMITTAKHPDLNWKQLHVDYERIHPFVDGNGRTGRMFMNWYRLKNGLPLLTIHEGEEQMEYYKWFK